MKIMILTDKSLRRLGIVLSGIVAAFMLLDATMKLIPLEVVLTTSRELGLPATPEFARLLAIIGLICTVLYILPQTAVLGAILLTAYMGGAIAAHLRIGNPLFSHVLFGAYVAILAWGGLFLREPRVRALMPIRSNSTI